jgi:hypothetical protein
MTGARILRIKLNQNKGMEFFELLNVTAKYKVPDNLFGIEQKKREVPAPISLPQKQFSAITSRKRKHIMVEGMFSDMGHHTIYLT